LEDGDKPRAPLEIFDKSGRQATNPENGRGLATVENVPGLSWASGSGSLDGVTQAGGRGLQVVCITEKGYFLTFSRTAQMQNFSFCGLIAGTA